MLNTGPKHCMVSICACKTSCTEFRHLPEANWCEVDRKKGISIYFNWQNDLKVAKMSNFYTKCTFQPYAHILGHWNLFRTHNRSRNIPHIFNFAKRNICRTLLPTVGAPKLLFCSQMFGEFEQKKYYSWKLFKAYAAPVPANLVTFFGSQYLF